MWIPTLLLVATAFADTVPRSRGVADTVTVLPPVHVESAAPKSPGRETATTARLDRARLVRYQPLLVADALLSVPGLDVSRSGPWASRIALRGLTGERVLVLVDGVRLQSGRGHGAQTSLVDVDRLEDVAVQPGAASSQFGSDALAGVVSINTHAPLLTETPATTLLLSSRMSEPGDAQQQHARLRWTSPLLGAELYGGVGSLNALVTPEGRVPNSGSRDQDVTGRVAARGGPFTADLEHAHHAAYDIGLPAFGTDSGTHGEYPLQGRDVDRFELTSPEASGRPAFSLLAVQQNFKTLFNETTLDSQYVRGRLVATRQTGSYDHITTRMSSVQPALHRGPFSAFGEWRMEQTSGPRRSDLVQRNAAGDVTATGTGYSESVPHARRDSWSLGSAFAPSRWGWRLELGGRYDLVRARADSTPQSFTHELDVYDVRWSGDAGISRSLGAWTPYARVASGVRIPNLEERYYNDDFHNGLQLFGNPDLRSEHSRNVEIGVRAAEVMGGRFSRLRVSLYRTNVEDLISLKYLGQLYLIPRFQYENINRARLQGAEAEATVNFGTLRFEVSGSAPRGKDLDTGDRLTDVGSETATFELRGIAPRLPRLAWAMRGRWQNAVPSPTAIPGEGESGDLGRPAFWTASTELATYVAGTRLSLSVLNLFDNSYREPMSFIPEAGRTFVVALRRDQPLTWPFVRKVSP